jgi:hypothetical protein
MCPVPDRFVNCLRQFIVSEGDHLEDVVYVSYKYVVNCLICKWNCCI